MWALHESYDPATQVLYLKELGKFSDAGDARKFTDGYLTSMAYKQDKVVSEVRCGEQRMGGCSRPGKPS